MVTQIYVGAADQSIQSQKQPMITQVYVDGCSAQPFTNPTITGTTTNILTMFNNRGHNYETPRGWGFILKSKNGVFEPE